MAESQSIGAQSIGAQSIGSAQPVEAHPLVESTRPASREAVLSDRCERGSFPHGLPSQSWISPRVLWHSRNHVLSKLIDPTASFRDNWISLASGRAEAREADPDFIIRRPPGGSGSVIVLGDPGEGDDSQLAVVPSLRAASNGVDFAIVCSDVIYPTGDGTDYERKFYQPYQGLDFPIYAVPGNHDWYDGLRGFAGNFCDLYAGDFSPWSTKLSHRIAKRLWRQKPALTPAEIAALRSRLRPEPDVAGDQVQPAPYFAIDAGDVRFVGIDTGIDGSIDIRQYEWLRRVSIDSSSDTPRAKVLLTGKPLYVNGHHQPGRVRDTTGKILKNTVDDIVTNPAAGYILVIGGDVHNYQRYPVKVGGRTIEYVVSGGGGAFMHDTHSIGKVDLPGVTEENFRCYPPRRDSLARFSKAVDERLFGGRGWATVTHEEAAWYFTHTLGINPLPRDDHAPPTRPHWWNRMKSAILRRFYCGPWFHRVWGSELFDWDRPRMYKQFVRLDQTSDGLLLRCYSASGCKEEMGQLAKEDQVVIPWPQP